MFLVSNRFALLGQNNVIISDDNPANVQPDDATTPYSEENALRAITKTRKVGQGECRRARGPTNYTHKLWALFCYVSSTVKMRPFLKTKIQTDCKHIIIKTRQD